MSIDKGRSGSVEKRPSRIQENLIPLGDRRAGLTIRLEKNTNLAHRVNNNPRTTDLRPWLWGAALTGRSEHLPREIAARGVHKALTEKIISQGESPRLRTGRSVVRGKRLW